MSIIGMYDYDMVNYAPTIFNLDIMKLAQYYKNQRDIVTVTKHLDTDKYTKLIYRKDYYDGLYDTDIILNPKVEYGGYAFSNNKQIMLPEEIEKLKPDKRAYESMRNLYTQNGTIYNKVFDRQMNAQHFRISLDGETIWDDWERQLNKNEMMQTFIIHDRDLAGIEGGYDMLRDFIQKVPNRKTKYIGTKFPIVPRTDKELLQWAQFKPMSIFYNIEYKKYYKDDILYKFTLLQDGTSISRQSIFWLTGDSTTQQDFVSHIPDVYKQLVFLRNNNRYFSLKYDKTIFEDERWYRVLDLIKLFYNVSFKPKMQWVRELGEKNTMGHFVGSFEDYVPYMDYFSNVETHWFTKEEAVQTMLFVKDACPELYYHFFRWGKIEFKGGQFVWN